MNNGSEASHVQFYKQDDDTSLVGVCKLKESGEDILDEVGGLGNAG